jgi:uncharacterized membrane protein YoaK (UPF0700 family)
MRINRIRVTSITLSFVAGFADTSTFVGADGLFSAHITGNFVVFAYDIVTNQISSSWIKLISFPVFILSVILSTLIIDNSKNFKKGSNGLLIIESLILIAAGGLTYFFRYEKWIYILRVFIPMAIVFALGLQNSFGRFSPKDVLAPTTVMTGNVTQLFIDMTNYLKHIKSGRQEFIDKIQNGICVILPFLIGCVSGGIITKSLGVSSIVIPGILVFILSRFTDSSNSNLIAAP